MYCEYKFGEDTGDDSQSNLAHELPKRTHHRTERFLWNCMPGTEPNQASLLPGQRLLKAASLYLGSSGVLGDPCRIFVSGLLLQL